MVRWLAPILTFTADEIWESMSDLNADSDSVILETWYALPDVGEITQDWGSVLQMRDEVAKAIEEKRSAGEIGSALEANLSLKAGGDKYAALASLGDELRFVFITSDAELTESKEEGLSISVAKSDAEKCVRCWHRRDDVGRHAEHPELCGRCVSNIEGEGENRQFA
jgi:isoleucyl-tRNA synthetase